MRLFAKISILFSFMLPSLVAAAQVADASGEPVSEEMQTYKEACLTERKGIRDKSQLSMMKAHKLFKGLKTAPFKYEVVSEEPKEALGRPVMEFTPDYCEYMIKNQYSIVPMDSLRPMRDATMKAMILTEDFSLQPNSAVTISVRARGNCSMLVVSEDGLPLKVTSSIDDKPLVFNSEEEGTVNWKTWTLPKTFRNMEFKIENPNNKQVSFGIAMQ